MTEPLHIVLDETLCDAAASFEELWREAHHQLVPHSTPVPRTRGVFVPVAYCRLPVKATPKALYANILGFYGARTPGPRRHDPRVRRPPRRDRGRLHRGCGRR
ncbi:hypothetical protein O1L60_42555 [Streptomyces diastatochromogenes]|nr:hypothetical protein [Streptomyces diastatochromogenes]